MHDAEFSGERAARVVAVFPDDAAAERAAGRVRAMGALDVAVNDPDDEVRALTGEMRQEVDNSWAGPAIGLATPEMARHAAIGAWAGALAGAVLGAPFGLMGPAALSPGQRLLIAGVVGAIAGATFGFLAGGFIGGRRRANLALAEERGAVVGIRAGHEPAVEALVGSGALRVDLTAGEGPVDTIASHEEHRPSDTVRDQPVPPADQP